MDYILTPDEMRKADATAIKKMNIPGIILMENAARSAAIHMYDIFEESGTDSPDILILCGSGNNGGDGFALARHLWDDHDVRIYWIGSEDKMSDETSTNYKAAKNIGIPMEYIESDADLKDLDFEADCIVDALLGVGGSENLRGLVLPIMQIVNDMDALKIAIDAPTGLNTETGAANDDSFLADHTITMFAKKTGMFLKDGIDVCGEIYKACLGAPDTIVQDIARIKVIGEEDPPFMMPFRPRRSTKFDYGRVLVVAGSENMPGAAALASNASISMGAGLVYLFTPNVHSAVLPEVIPTKVQTTEEGTISKYSLENILDAAKKVDVIAIGPGFGDNIETIGLVRELIERVPDNVSLVIDADALRAIDTTSSLRKNIILTPHTGEFARMIDVPREEVENHPHDLAKRWAKKLNCIIHLKYVPSIITDGDETYWNINGNPGMATAGCGDVLTGMIASLIAQGLKPLRASALAAFLHSLAGDWYAINYGEETLTASKMIEALRIVMSENIWELD